MVDKAYFIFESRTGYCDGYYTSRTGAVDQCNDLKRDFPNGMFMVFKLEYKAQESIRLIAKPSDQWRILTEGLGGK